MFSTKQLLCVKAAQTYLMGLSFKCYSHDIQNQLHHYIIGYLYRGTPAFMMQCL